jgi:hypothetical protein
MLSGIGRLEMHRAEPSRAIRFEPLFKSPWEALATLAAAILSPLAMWRLGASGVNPFLILVGCIALIVAAFLAARAIVCIHTIAAEPVEERQDHQRHRTIARGVQAADQDADRAALRRNRRHAVLGFARFRTDQHAKDRRLADARNCAHRSAH